MARIALTSFRKNPKLGECDPRSVFAAVIMAAQLGWEVGIGGQAHLVPYKRADQATLECQLVPGWMGLADLVFRAGRAMVWTGAVYEGDEFEYGLGDSPFLKHRPLDPASEKLIAVYAVGRVKGAEWPVVEVWPISKVLAHRDRYNKVGGKHYSFQHLEMYARKVALLQVIKYMPKSSELQLALQLDQTAMNSPQNLTFSDAIDGTWVADQSEDETTPPEEAKPASATEAVKNQLRSRSEEKRVSAQQVDETWPKNPKNPKDAA